ncbi:MAG: hypothetical protein WHS88_00385 [Anaerohalosphaeraceae bacterium]
MNKRKTKQTRQQSGSALIVAVVLLLVLSILSVGVLKSAEGAHMQAVRQKRQSAALAAAEAAYERAMFAMSQQSDLLSALAAGTFEETLSFPDSQGSYSVSLATFLQAKPIFEITAIGRSGMYEKTIHTYAVQAINGWAMGKCKAPVGGSSFIDVVFATGEVVDLPIEINKENDSPDVRDIKIQGNPVFLRPVYMGESRYTVGGTDKYSSVMNCFRGGIYFDQPMLRISDDTGLESKIQRFRDSTAPQFRFTPTAFASTLTLPQPAVHLEFFVENGIGKVCITNNCTVRGFMQTQDSRTYDFRVVPGSSGERFERYPIYAYHVRRTNADTNGDRFTVDLTQTYVSQEFGGVSSAPAGQIFVNGNVIIGSGRTLGQQTNVVQGQMSVVATGNIWIAHSLTISDRDNSGRTYPRQANGLPHPENPNILGLIAKGVIKIVDPGMTEYSYVDTTPKEPAGFTYVPIGNRESAAKPAYMRLLPNPTIVEAALTIGGGGWGAENVKRNNYGGRKTVSASNDQLILRGSITEAVRGVVGVVGQDGYLKSYFWDERLLTGILPGNIWLKGKYVPVPGAWTETQTVLAQ